MTIFNFYMMFVTKNYFNVSDIYFSGLTWLVVFLVDFLVDLPMYQLGVLEYVSITTTDIDIMLIIHI